VTDLSKHRRRLVWALALTGVAALVAAAAMIASVVMHRPDLMSIVIVAVIFGVGAQIWFIIRFVRDK
jgi:hypothetical protein